MKINTKIFGEIEIAADKVITFPGGIIGFPDMTSFTLLYDEEKGTEAGIRWLQSIDEPAFAMPVMDPLTVKPDYNPSVDDELLKCIGGIREDNLLVLVTLTVPSDPTQMSVNLQGPIVVNADKRLACQVILDTELYPVKFPIYELLRAGKEGE